MWQTLTVMSAQEILAALPKLNRAELERLDARLHELLQHNGESSSKCWSVALEELAGTAEGLPADLAHNHDHYLHNAPKR